MKHYRVKKFIDFKDAETYYGIECKLHGQWYVAMEHGEVLCWEIEEEAQEMCDILNTSGKGPVVVEEPTSKLKVV